MQSVQDIFFSIRLWRRPRIYAMAKPATAPSPETGWSLSATKSANPTSVSTNDPPIFQLRPEIRQARLRLARFTLLSMACYAAIAVLAVLMLGRTGYLPTGETCAALLGPGSTHPSLACDAWRHHQLLLFLAPAGALVALCLWTFYLQFRAFRNLKIQRKVVSQ